jgi:hypothetical protein
MKYITDSKKVEQVNFKKQEEQNTPRRLKTLMHNKMSACERFKRKNVSLNNIRLLRILAYTTQHMLSL